MDDSSTSGHFLSRAKEKVKRSPFFYTAATAMFGMVGAGIYGLKNRKMRLSLYLINLRLAAQGSFVGILFLGVGYSIAKQFTSSKAEDNAPHAKK